MSATVFVAWTIDPVCEPQPIRNCSRCKAARPFGSSGLFRLNANGKRLDAWLIYRCSHCDNAWNRSIFERRKINEIDRALLAALQVNDAHLARRIAFDVNDLGRTRIESMQEARTTKRLVSGDALGADHVEIALSSPQPVALRLDRVLALELSLSRQRLRQLDERGRIATSPRVRLRASLVDGLRIRIDLADEHDRRAIITAAAGLALDSTSPPIS
ncbi:DUF1062 domain-containing protein [Terrarubrum flagellatum]|uniref:DUF1062 domain-containing protein n=1 Tax=Terrirubrum flagellatum TaxID=2895980 RepID=UPI0031451073